MTYINDFNIINNIQVWYRHNRLVNLANDDRVWREDFRAWLKEQGCEIDPGPGNNRLLRNGLGIAPHYDRLRFEDDRDATVFILRWS